MDNRPANSRTEPRYLYRVQYLSSQVGLTTPSGLVAADTTTVFPKSSPGWQARLATAAVNHFTWSSRVPSPFISLFSNKRHAENWGLREPWGGPRGGGHLSLRDDDWVLLTVDLYLLIKDTLYSAENLVDALHLFIEGRARQHVPGGYLCLHRVPPEAIVSVELAEDIRKCEYLPTF